jgi:hypothetical protein
MTCPLYSKLSAAIEVSSRPQDQKRDHIGDYYNRVLQKVNLTLRDFDTFRQVIAWREAVLDHVKCILMSHMRTATREWVGVYKQIKEPENPENPADGIQALCLLCIKSYNETIDATSIEVFRVKFQRLDQTVIGVSNRATSILTSHNLPVSR